MIFDFNTPSILGDFLQFPDWPFSPVPLANIEQTTIIGGGATSIAVIQGSVQ